MPTFTLTTREGPRVTREKHETLNAALDALASRLEQIRSDGGLPAVKMLREFEPGQRVQARFEISSGRMLRRREAGVDLMGDGSVIPYSGGAFRSHIDPPEGTEYIDAVADALRE